MHDGDYGSAAEAYGVLLTRPLDDGMSARSLFGLGKAHLYDQAYAKASDAFQELLTEHPGSSQMHDATFLLADALVGAGEPLSATKAYSRYLQAGTVITPYVNLSLGDALRAAGVYTATLAPYRRAINEAPSRAFEVDAREKLALAHVAQGAYAAAVEQYDAILSVARQSAYRAYVEYQAAETLLLSGATEAGYQRHTNVVETYPTDEHAYQSLVKLVQAGRPVNDLLRGQVDYYGGAYGPAVQALYRYIYAYPDTHSGDAHWYAGLSYWEAGSPDLAVNEFELLIDTHPENRFWGHAWLKLAELHAVQGRTEEAVSTYRAFVDAAPEHALAPEALWEAAQLLERAGMIESAATQYLDCQSAYPGSDVAPGALFRGGLQLYQLGDGSARAEAAEAWETLADRYPDASDRQAALLWLGKLRLEEGETEAARTVLEAAVGAAPDQYYGLRAAQIAPAPGVTPSPSPDDELHHDTGSRDETEAWLADWMALESADGGPEDLGELSPRLATDARLRRGRELWRLGRFQQAKAELEAVRVQTYANPLDQYQLALAYRDLGLYRSSILCAWRVIGLSPVTTTLDAPRFLLRLAYPTYYENLVLDNVQKTGLDPHLIFSLIRQESLFESLATSSASAQGLMQVIPPTGAEIAGELGWPPDYATSDLYHP
jgi:soluble lytic murein transglycosylase